MNSSCMRLAFVSAAILMTTWFLLPVVAQPQVAPGKSLSSGIVRIEDAIPTRGDWGEWLRYFRSDTHGTKDMVVLAVTLKPGQEPHPPHQHAEEEIMIVTEGTGIWHLDGRETPAKKGDVLYAAPWSMHGVKNTGAIPLTYCMVKWGSKGVQAPEKPKPEKPAEPGKPRQVACLKGHTNRVTAIALSADGRMLVSGCDDKTAKIWDVATGRERFTLRGHRSAVDIVAITPDGSTVVTVEADGIIKLWDAATGLERGTLSDRRRAVHDAWLLADGRTFACQFKPTQIERWDIHLQINLAPIQFAKGEQFNPASGMVTWFDSKITAFSKDGKTALARGKDDGILLWELSTQKQRLQMSGVARRSFFRAAFHPTGRVFACIHERVPDPIKIADAVTGELLLELNGDDQDRFYDVTFSADGNFLASAEGPDTTIRVWDVSGLWIPKAATSTSLTDADLTALWSDLAGEDAAKAYQAMWRLADAPDGSVPMFARNLSPILAADPQRTAALIADLDSERFATRDRATRSLEELGEAAIPALRKALIGNQSIESRRRIEDLLMRFSTSATLPEAVRILRAIEALEHANSPGARQVLEALANGIPEARQTREAKAAVARLNMTRRR